LAEAAMSASRFVCVIAVLLVGVPAWADDLTTLTPGKSLSGTLATITDNDITFTVSGKKMGVQMSQALLLTLRPHRDVPANPKYIDVQLLDESVLRCTKMTFSAKEAELELTSGTAVKVPVASVLSFVRDAGDDNIKKQWAAAQDDRRRQDRIFVLQEGVLKGLPGVMGEIDEKKQTVKFKLDTGEIEPKLDKIAALQLVRTDLPAAQSLCKVIDVDGNVLVASKLAYSGGPLTVTTPFGAKVALDLSKVAKLDFNFGRLTYLSDLDAKMSETAFLGGFNPVRKDANLDGNPIILQDKKYEKGLSMYAGVDLEYNLGGKYKDFKALLGVDTRIAEEGQGNVTVTIYCDGEKRSSFDVSVKAPTPIAVNVKDVQKLKIVVRGSNFTNFSGHAMLANAHVSQ
jgi:hypothetical protein